MPGQEKLSPVTIGIMAAMALSSLLLPAAALLLLAASGLVELRPFSAPADRYLALVLGMFAGGFGVCTAPLGLPLLLHKGLFLPQKAALAVGRALANPWLNAALLPGLACYAYRALAASDPGGSGEWLPLAALTLLAGNAVRVGLEVRGLLDKKNFGEAAFDQDELFCAPGARGEATLRMANRAVSVTTALEFYAEDKDEPAASYPAETSAPQPGARGWAYTARFTMPADAAGREGFWELTATAQGHHITEKIFSLPVWPREQP